MKLKFLNSKLPLMALLVIQINASAHTPIAKSEKRKSTHQHQHQHKIAHTHDHKDSAENHSDILSEAEAKTQATTLLKSANQPGFSHNHQSAEALLNPHIKTSTDPEVWYMWARIKQHNHEFNAAKTQLSRIFKQHPNDVPSHLMAARLALIDRDLDRAKQHCRKVIGQVDVMTASICLLEVESYQGDLAQSYKQLTTMLNRQPVPKSHQNWVTLMLTDMALRNNDLAAANAHLEQFPDFTNLSYLSTWSDVKLKNNEPKLVLKTLGEIYTQTENLEDGLILRLALAEQKMNLNTQTDTHTWQKRLKNRLETRAEHNETMHANEMSRYYLSINPDPEKALYWAKKNWEKSKEHQDELLLFEAQSLQAM